MRIFAPVIWLGRKPIFLQPRNATLFAIPPHGSDCVSNHGDCFDEVSDVRPFVVNVGAPGEEAEYKSDECKDQTETHYDKEAFEKHRCLVPADGFYEWKTINTKKFPYRITQPDGDLFCFAGLWDEPMNAFTIITTAANETMKLLHHRMPLILKSEHYSVWFDDGLFKTVLDDSRNAPLKIYPVSPLVNSPKNETPACIEPFTPPEEAQRDLF